MLIHGLVAAAAVAGAAAAHAAVQSQDATLQAFLDKMSEAQQLAQKITSNAGGECPETACPETSASSPDPVHSPAFEFADVAPAASRRLASTGGVVGNISTRLHGRTLTLGVFNDVHASQGRPMRYFLDRFEAACQCTVEVVEYPSLLEGLTRYE